jgi:hypothetical protein
MSDSIRNCEPSRSGQSPFYVVTKRGKRFQNMENRTKLVPQQDLTSAKFLKYHISF